MPFANWDGNDGPFDVIDYVVLAGDATPEGFTIVDSAPTIDGIAAAIFHLTLGRLAAVLRRQLSLGIERLAWRGRFIALGAAALQIAPDELSQTLADYLQRQLVRLMTEEYEQGHPGSDNDTPDDTFRQVVREVPQQIVSAGAEPLASPGDVKLLEDRFKAARWDIRLLQRMQAWRLALLGAYQQELLRAGTVAR